MTTRWQELDAMIPPASRRYLNGNHRTPRVQRPIQRAEFVAEATTYARRLRLTPDVLTAALTELNKRQERPMTAEQVDRLVAALLPPETDAQFEARIARAGVTAEEVEVYRRLHYGERYVPPPTRPDFRSAATIGAPTDVEDWDVEGVVRPKSLFVIGAAEGTAKTQIVCELAVRAVTGTGSLFGHYTIPKPLRVMVLDEENGEAEEYRREDAILATLGLARATLTNYFRASFAGMVLTDPASQRWLDGQVENIKPDLVVLDTGTSMIGDEWGGEMKAAMRYVRSLIVRYGCSVAVLVHLVKPSRDRRPNDPIHGSAMSHVMGQWTRVADSVALVADLGDDRLRFEMRKKVPPSTLILVKRDGIFDVVSIGEARKPSTDDRTLRAIAAGGIGPDDIASRGASSTISLPDPLPTSP